MRPIGYSERPSRVSERLAELGLDALIVSDLLNVRWLTGFTGSNGRVVVAPGRVSIVTDGRYRERAADEFAAAGVDVDVVVGSTVDEQHDLLVDLVAGLDAVGADTANLTYDHYQALARELSLVPAGGIIEAERRVKEGGEVDRIAAAAAAADAALAEVAPDLPGMTEHDVRTELDYRMRRHGADGAGYDTIVAAGPEHAARPHHEPSRRTIVEGDTVVIDVGGVVDGYRSDMTRTYVIGDARADQRERYDLVRASQQAGLDAVRTGASAAAVDAACRDVFVEAGHGDEFLHSTGHGVGLYIHEPPIMNARSDATLRSGEVVTVEPGLYRVGVGGIRIEDLVVVDDTGCRILTHTPKDSPCPPSPPTT